jgi:hypothetical protein
VLEEFLSKEDYLHFNKQRDSLIILSGTVFHYLPTTVTEYYIHTFAKAITFPYLRVNK